MGKKSDKVKPTQQEIALADISKKQFARYQSTFAPLEDKWLKESRVSGGEKDLLAGHIAGDVSQDVAGHEKQMVGMSPASGNFTAGARDLAVGKGRALGRGATEGNMQAENADVTALMSGIRLGRGQAIEAQAGMEDMAGQATSRAINKAFNKQSDRAATAGLVGSAAGAAAYGVGKIGTAAPAAAEGVAAPQWTGTDYNGTNYSLMRGTAKPAANRYSLNLNL